MFPLLLSLVGLFVGSNVATEYANRRTLDPRKEPMSAYLAGAPWAWLQDLGFVALSVALVVLGNALVATEGPAVAFMAPKAALAAALLLDLGAAALMLVVATKYGTTYLTDRTARARMQKLHLAAAGVAFGATDVALLVISWHLTWWHVALAGLVLPVAAAIYALAPDETAVQEKAAAGVLVGALGAVLMTLWQLWAA